MKVMEWDPLPDQREMFRDRMTGDIGWKVIRKGEDSIRLALPGAEVIRPYSPSEWEPKDPKRRVSRFDVAIVAFKADLELCRVLGIRVTAKKNWLDLTEMERQEWMYRGPKEAERSRLYNAIMAAIGRSE